MSDLRAALEAALAESPDDDATRMAYADHLTDSGDPRGEFIQVQCALEDESRPAAQRRRLRTREKQLLKQHVREWLGPELAKYVLDGYKADIGLYADDIADRAGVAYRRGAVDRLTVAILSATAAQDLARSPALRLLRELTLHGSDAPAAAAALGRARNLGNVRALIVRDDAAEVLGRIDVMLPAFPRLEELHIDCREAEPKQLFECSSLTHLRVLTLRNVAPPRLRLLADNPAFARLERLEIYPPTVGSSDPASLRLADVRAVARSPHLKSLKYLVLHRGDFGDAGVLQIVKSGLLCRLEVLDVCKGSITDRGARLLAECPDLKHLSRLAIEENRLSDEGIELLAATGVSVYAAKQYVPDDDGHYFDAHRYQDDWE